MKFDCKTEIPTLKQALNIVGIQSDGRLQKYIDNEVMKGMNDYIPVMSSNMRKSVLLNTIPGSGEIIVKTPYAHYQYIHNAGTGKQGMSRGGKAGKLFFDRYIADNKAFLIRKCAEYSGGRIR